MKPEEWRAYVRKLARELCVRKHQDRYGSLICAGPSRSGSGPPCDECVAVVEHDLEEKRRKSDEVQLSLQEVTRLKERRGRS